MVLEYIPYIPIAVFIFYIFKNPEKIEIWSGLIAQCFSHFSKKAERHSVSADIQAKISSYIKNYSVKGVLPYGIKFKWVDKENFESFVEEGDVIIIMGKHQNNAKNFLNAVVAYTSQALFPSVRSYLPTEFLIASEVIVQEKMIREKRSDALSLFKEEIESKRIAQNVEIKKMKERLSRMDTNGYFETILLPEITHAGFRLQELEESKRKNEVHGFITFLENIANRSAGDESAPLRYNGECFHVAIVLIAKHIKMMAEGIRPYVKRVQEAIGKQFDSIYLMARGDSSKFMEKVEDAIKVETNATFQWKKSFKTKDGRKRKTYATVVLFRV